MADSISSQQPESVEAPSAQEPVVKLFILAAMCLGFGIWMIYDHYIEGNYPYAAYKSVDNLGEVFGYLSNHYGPFILIPLGLIPFIKGGRLMRRKLIADGAGIGYEGKDSIAWNDVKEVDARQLGPKGLLTVVANDGRTLKLDSYLLQNFRAVVALLEKKVPAEKIVR